MSRIKNVDIYKPELVHFEMQHFRYYDVCWFSGPYYTHKIKILRILPLEILQERLRLKLAKARLASTYYQTYSLRDKRLLRLKVSLLYVYIKSLLLSTTVGFRRALRVRGVGYRFESFPTKILIQAGYSHFLSKKLPFFKMFQSVVVNKKATLLAMKSHDLETLGIFFSMLRNLRKPDVYKGKGIRYQNELLVRKEGKKKRTA